MGDYMYAYFFFQMCLVISVTKPRYVGTYLVFKDGFKSNSSNIEAQFVEASLKFDFIERETLVIKRSMPRRFIFVHKKKKICLKLSFNRKPAI